MQRHEQMLVPEGLNQAVANFCMLLRVLEPELTEYFENEEVEPNSWVPSWLQTLLAGQLRISCVLRLWDTYFSCKEVRPNVLFLSYLLPSAHGQSLRFGLPCLTTPL